MPVKISVIANCDDAVVFWRTDAPIPACLGFVLERETKEANGQLHRAVVHNRMGFAKDNPTVGDHRPSDEWPFQRFSWADHAMDVGKTVRYRVVPMVRGASDELVRVASEASAWSKWVTLSASAGSKVSLVFNRGLVISQFMARYLAELRQREGLSTTTEALKVFKDSLSDHETPIRKFLSGELRETLLALLQDVKKKKGHVFAALYELEDGELIDALAALKSKAHVVLANGSVKVKGKDQNAAGRKAIKKAKVEVFDRMVAPGALGHNKFLVVANDKQKPVSVWTGSTNWTKTGLCTQINNGIRIDDAAVAQRYLEQWKRLRDAKSSFPPSLSDANSSPTTHKVGKSAVDVWFTRARKGVDLEALDEVVNGAQDALLFLMFMPGSKGVLKTVRARMKKTPSFYVQGVVSTLPGEDEDAVDATAIGSGGESSVRDLRVVQPEGFTHPFASWAATVTRREFATVGTAIVHSKVLVADPFTNPVVVTGSHNFSSSASAKNDENFVIVRGNAELAQEMAVHILSVYQHYRWLAYVADLQRKNKKPAGVLQEVASWQDRHLTGKPGKELKFWCP